MHLQAVIAERFFWGGKGGGGRKGGGGGGGTQGDLAIAPPIVAAHLAVSVLRARRGLKGPRGAEIIRGALQLCGACGTVVATGARRAICAKTIGVDAVAHHGKLRAEPSVWAAHGDAA